MVGEKPSCKSKISPNKNFFLVRVKGEITGSNMPSGEDIISLLLHQQINKITGIPLRRSFSLDSAAVQDFRDQAKIPTIQKNTTIDKIEKLCKKYQALKKRPNKTIGPADFQRKGSLLSR
ncbi:hypothetical protein Pmani_004259 [Petrolisthes manimaculis]|uniref:Uncharacterized protein n=1 Tax=Petrolisthes manimaculis TaxID=1843537 RepID=A0AAE1QDY9_9EUCA|nr:hypothetical protein Pmani_004259 [Petrolisthes manimaculis]